MTTDTVHAADLAAALRRALPFLREADDLLSIYSETEDQREEIERLEDLIPSLLDRWDAQCREELEADIAYAILQRDGYVGWARKARANDSPNTAELVEDARRCNWYAVKLRRQLRAIGGDA